jgi:hypothetical protein
LASLEEDAVSVAPRERTDALEAQALSHRKHQLGTDGISTMYCLQGDAFNKEATSETLPSPIRHCRIMVFTGDNTPKVGEMPDLHGDASMEENDAQRRHRRRH